MTLTVGQWYNVAHRRAQGPLQFAGHRKLWGYIYLTFWGRPGAAVVFDSQQARALMNENKVTSYGRVPGANKDR